MQASRAYVGGIVYGPHERLSMLQYLEAMPPGYPLRQYPDVCHTMNSQFEVYQWDAALAFTHNRQAVYPMPRMVGAGRPRHILPWRPHTPPSFPPCPARMHAHARPAPVPRP